MAGIKIDFLADVGKFIKGAGDVEQALDKVVDSLDDLQRDAKRAGEAVGDELKDGGRDAESAGEKLERKFRDTFNDVDKQAKKAGDDIGDGVRKGTKKAESAVDEFRGEANQTARESAASFSGEFEDAADAIQEVLANALAGFGPIGAAAGIAAAVGVGALIGGMQTAAEKTAEAKDRAIELAEALSDVGGDTAAIDWAEKLRESLLEVVDEKKWFEFWQDLPKTRLEEWADAADRFGVDWADITQAMQGDTEALARVQSILNDEIKRSEQYFSDHASQQGDFATAYDTTSAAAQLFSDQLAAQNDLVNQGVALNDGLTGALAGVSEGELRASESVQAYNEATAAALTGAGEAWDKYVEDGKVNLAEYNAAIEAQQAAVVAFEANMVVASATLSAEALNYIRAMGPEAAPLLQAFVDAPLDQQRRTADNWASLGRTATEGYRSSLDLTGPTAGAISSAQSYAANNPIYARVAADLSEFNRAAYNIGLPGRAKGGPVDEGQPYVVGEQGQELFVPDQDGTIIPAGRTRDLLAGTGGRAVVQSGGVDSATIGAAVAGALQGMSLTLSIDGQPIRGIIRAENSALATQRRRVAV